MHGLYFIRYSPLNVLLVWDTGDWSFCPAVLFSGDESLVAEVGEPEGFVAAGCEFLSLRIYDQGMGALQQSLFFAVVEDTLVQLEVQPVADALAQAGLATRHRGGGFCRGGLS